MRVLVISSGHDFSTIDIFTGLCAGLEARGVEVVPYPLHDWLESSLVATQLLREANAGYYLMDAYAWAAQPAIGLALWRECTHMIAITGSNLHASIPMTLQKAGIRSALVCTESPYLTRARERYDAIPYDYVFTNERTAVPLFDRTPGRVSYLPHAYNAAVHHPGPIDPAKVCDVFFCGTAFDERQALFAGVDWTGISLVRRGPLWDGSQDADQILRSTVKNTELPAHYRAARVSLNHHRTTGDWRKREQISDVAESLGPRAYEIPASGGFLLSDARAELRDVFTDTVPTYANGDSADLERKICYWLGHDDARERLQAAQHEAIQPHSWADRAAQILERIA
jgi:hypothetical protein